jgi:hypothetical protein
MGMGIGIAIDGDRVGVDRRGGVGQSEDDYQSVYGVYQKHEGIGGGYRQKRRSAI